MPDKYKATWVSHSSISNFLTCPRLYYLRNVYKDPKTGNKITIIKPPLTLGQKVHEVIESLSSLPVEERFKVSLLKKFDVAWDKTRGKMGGFSSEKEEKEYKQRGIDMLKKITKNPGPLANKAIKIRQELPFYWLSEKDNIILCGKVDWLEYIPANDSVHVIDFKTGKKEEKSDSLQLPIYNLLVTNTQSRAVNAASYWYLQHDEKPVKQKLTDLAQAYDEVYDVAKRVKLARQIEHFSCPKGGCFACSQLERILDGEGEKVGVSEYRQDLYILNN